jgi:Ca-activated chloride channel family protein
MNAKKISGALIGSLMIHGIIMLIASIFYVTQTAHFKDAVSVEFLSLKKSPLPQVRKPLAKFVVKPIIPIDRPFLVAQSQVQPRIMTHSSAHPAPSIQPQTVLEFSNKVVKLDAPINPNVPEVVSAIRGTDSEQVTVTNHSQSAAPTNADRGTGGVVQVKAAFERPAGLAMVNHIGARRDGSGNVGVPPLNPPNGEAYHDMYFKGSGTNPFIDTEDDHLSTFAMDVDTGSYSVTRRYLTDGYLPPPEAVRVEEFVNTFDYNYDLPTEDAFAIHIDGAPSMFGEGKRLQLLRIGLQGREVPSEHRKDAILTFIIDVSGSMDMENRLELVKKALTLLVNQLRPTDKVGIVVYGSRGRLLLSHTGINQRTEILAAINSLRPDGSTNAEEGLRIGYDLAWRNASVNHINRVILCSDGVANVGNTGPDAILKEIRTYVNKGITLSTVGFGMGNYNDVLMERLADTGNGNYAYVDTLSEAKRIFVENLTGTLQVIAKDAKIQVDFNPNVVSRFRLLGYENRRLDHEQFRDDTVDAGEVGAGHQVTALYEVKLHPDTTGKMATVSIRYADPDNHKVSEVSKDISVSQLHESFDTAPATFRLAAAVAEFAEILRESYWAKDGSLDAAHQVVKDTFAEIDSDQVIELMYLVDKANTYKEEES